MVWIKRSKETIWDKSHNGIPSGMLAGISVSVQGEKNADWVPDVSRGWGMKRSNPINRVIGYTHVSAVYRGCYPVHNEIFISWSRIPAKDDPCFNQYQKDITSPKYLGIHKTSSHVTTALKNWMQSEGIKL